MSVKETVARGARALSGGAHALASAARTLALFAQPGVVRVSGKMDIGSRCKINCHAGGLLVLEDVHLAPGVEIVVNPEGRLVIEGCYIGFNSRIQARGEVKIGRGSLVAEFVRIEAKRNAPVWVGVNVWLASRVEVYGGSTIHAHSVVGANGRVEGEIPPYSLALGAPARPVRSWSGGRTPK